MSLYLNEFQFRFFCIEDIRQYLNFKIIRTGADRLIGVVILGTGNMGHYVSHIETYREYVKSLEVF